MNISDIAEFLGSEAKSLLEHTCKGIPATQISQPGPDFIERVLSHSDRSVPVLRSIQSLYDHGRLNGTGYLSILPVDQGR